VEVELEWYESGVEDFERSVSVVCHHIHRCDFQLKQRFCNVEIIYLSIFVACRLSNDNFSSQHVVCV